MTLNDIIYYRNKDDPATSNIILRNNILSSLLCASINDLYFRFRFPFLNSTHPIWSSPSCDHRNSFHFGSHPPPTNQTCPICSSHTLLHSFYLSIHLLPACLSFALPPGTPYRELELGHQRMLKDTERNYSIERQTLEQRDAQNGQEIDTLHRKCRCLTKL